MKKTITILMMCVLALTGVAQNKTQKHLEFMGIPLTGTIDAFQKKLVAKGCSVSPANKVAPVGLRRFKGTFAEEEAEMSVWYNSRTKIVYKARIGIACSTLKAVRAKFDEYKALLKEKYEENGISLDEMIDEYEGDFEREDHDYVWWIYDKKVSEDAEYLGIINVYIYDDDSYWLIIDYCDYQNNTKNEKERMSDL